MKLLSKNGSRIYARRSFVASRSIYEFANDSPPFELERVGSTASLRLVHSQIGLD